ncbi:MAG: hypothetical protein UW54_C0010G0013 [Parcubacteria group bacterium GW2011_GWC1_44_26]|nr:MAG: hypothetical protein UW54_C0010G0013 [Parcubacteria group bacterium GW2011_GWC1_44_26]
MCFSATASFVAGTALSATGAVTLAETKKKSDIPFASIPLLFGIQQFVEGAVWLSFQYSAQIFNHIATYAYLGLAYVLWPIFVPLSVGLLETDSHRKKILYGFQFVGLAVGLYLLYFILSNPVASQIVNKSIVYSMPSQYGVLLVACNRVLLYNVLFLHCFIRICVVLFCCCAESRGVPVFYEGW